MNLIGHREPFDRFLRALGEERLHHAWLLHGPKGIGKARLAEEMARAALCEGNRGQTTASAACGRCHGCRMIAADAHPDLLRLAREEEKRDISIAQVRHLLDFLALSGAESSRRVALLDEAETMNPQAANALLKGLEEPGQGALLLIVCADAERLPATIRSRCLLTSCAPLDTAQIQNLLTPLGIEPAYHTLAIELAAGSPGRIVPLGDPKIAEQLEHWRDLIADPDRFDPGKVEAWLTANLAKVPHALVIDLVLNVATPLWQLRPSLRGRDAVAQALFDLARWPQMVARHTLRPVPTLLALLLGLRLALRD